MNKQDWDKCFLWLASIFPQWNTSAATSAAWYDELKAFAPDAVLDAVRDLRSKKPSPYPPGVFEIKAELEQELFPALDAEEAWQFVITNYNKLPAGLPPAVYKARRNIIGNTNLGLVDFDELKWVKKNFINYYNEISESTPELACFNSEEKFRLKEGKQVLSLEPGE